VVTGSTRGIGKAIARALGQAGAMVVISSRRQEACEAVASEFRAEGLEVMALACHVGHRDQLQGLVDQTMKAWGRIDILVCNAATNPVYGPMAEIADDAFDKIMGTNVRSVFQLCNMVCPGMAERGRGSVILISSIAALRGNAVIGVYGISKAAEAGLARNLAVEWGPKGVRVNAIAPGLIRTDFARALLEDPVRRQRSEQATPLRRIGEPEDIAGVALFLASDAAAFVTGQTIVADGGETIC
jgi:NAD(P)-dependent dehydrogenase (short-subunit alcohol dehydrogenase family)